MYRRNPLLEFVGLIRIEHVTCEDTGIRQNVRPIWSCDAKRPLVLVTHDAISFVAMDLAELCVVGNVTDNVHHVFVRARRRSLRRD